MAIYEVFLYAGVALLFFLAVSQFVRLYRVEDMLVLYMCDGGTVREIDISYRIRDNGWLSITEMERFIATDCGVSGVKVLSILFYGRKWRI